MTLKLAFVLALGGALGTLARFGLSLAASPYSQSMPWGTILINIVGSFVIGAFGTLTLNHGRYPVSEPARLFVMVGLCGGFTTFSAFSLQTFDLLRSGATMRALFNGVFSVTACVAAVALGHWLAEHVNASVTPIAQTRDEKLG